MGREPDFGRWGSLLFCAFYCARLQISSYRIFCHKQEKSVLFFPARCNSYHFYMEILICSDCAVAALFNMPSNNHTASASYGTSMVAGFRKWAVALVKNLTTDMDMAPFRNERHIIHALKQRYGNAWLSSILLGSSGGSPFSMQPAAGG